MQVHKGDFNMFICKVRVNNNDNNEMNYPQLLHELIIPIILENVVDDKLT